MEVATSCLYLAIVHIFFTPNHSVQQLFSKNDDFDLAESVFLDIPPFFADEKQNYVQCSHMCAWMDKCFAFNYDVTTHICSLLSEVPEDLLLAPSPTHISGILVRKYNKDDTKYTCRDRPCEADQLCVTTSSGNRYVCVKGPTCSTAPSAERMMSKMGVVSMTSGQATYSCDSGYRRAIGSGNSICSEDNGWTRPSLVCVGVDCGPPPELDHKTVTSVNSTLYQATVKYTCNTGYNRTDGNGYSTCQANRRWSAPSLECEDVDCGPPPDLDRQTVTSVTSTLYQATVEYVCDIGYNRTEGNGFSSCQANRTWTVTSLECEVVDCGTPLLSNAYNVSYTNTTYQSSSVYQCNLGFYVPGNGISYCRSNGQWYPTCKGIPGLTSTKALPALPVGESPPLQCRTVMSNPVRKTDVGNAANCAGDEILTGCSARISDKETQMRGSYVKYGACFAAFVNDTQAVGRCCKIPGMQCEYVRLVTSSMFCQKNFQLLDCFCQLGKDCATEMTNSTCQRVTPGKVYLGAVCCSHDNLFCYVKEAKDKNEKRELTATCEDGETMTACSGYNPDRQIQSAVIEERDRVDTCVIYPGSGNFSTVTGYVSCCKYKSV